MRANETITIVASKMLKPSIRKLPLEANDLSMISIKKIVRKTKSMSPIIYSSSVKSDDKVKSKRMNTEYNPIVKSDKFSVY